MISKRLAHQQFHFSVWKCSSQSFKRFV